MQIAAIAMMMRVRLKTWAGAHIINVHTRRRSTSRNIVEFEATVERDFRAAQLISNHKIRQNQLNIMFIVQKLSSSKLQEPNTPLSGLRMMVKTSIDILANVSESCSADA